MKLLRLLCVLLFVFAASAWAGGTTLADVGKFLDEGKIAYTKTAPDTIEFKTAFPDGKSQTFMVHVDEERRFLYLAVVGFAQVKADDKEFCAKARKLLNLNYGVAPAKVEWDEKTGDVRLSKSFETDEGLTRAQFMGAVQVLLTIAEQLNGKI